MTVMEDLVIVESKDYAQVVFDDVRECFTESAPLECVFTLNELLKADAADWVGIYKVGFRNLQDFVCSQPVDVDQLVADNKGKVTFPGESLPKDDGDFYQFVFVSQAKQVRGASIPFQFKKTHLSDLVAVEESAETVVIKSKETAINDTISEIKTRCVNLTHANDTYEKLVKENEDLIQALKEEVTSVKLRCLRLTMDNEKLNYTLRNKADSLRNLAETISNLTNENNRLQCRFDDVTNENKNLLDSLQQRIDQVAQLKNDLETVRVNKGELESILNIKESELQQLRRDKDELNRIADDLRHINDQISKLEQQVDERVDELNKIKSDLKRNEALVGEQAQTIQNILSERDTLNCLIQKLTKEKNDLEFNQENLSQELNMSRDKLLAAEQCKEMLHAQLVALGEELSQANAKHNNDAALIDELSEREKQLEIQKSELVEMLQKMKREFELKLEESNGAYYALNLAHVHLEARLRTHEQQRQHADKETDSAREHADKLQAENDELKERIRAGAKEYSKLSEKYRLLKNQQFNFDMNLYQEYSNNTANLNNKLNAGQTPITCMPHMTNLSRCGKHIPHMVRDAFATSTPNTEPDSDQDLVDSAIQDKTLSQSTRASSADIENTLLDALLGASFYHGWTGNCDKQREITKQASNLQQKLAQLNVATTTQPKLTVLPKQQSTELNDDELVQQPKQHQQQQQQQQQPQKQILVSESASDSSAGFNQQNVETPIREKSFETSFSGGDNVEFADHKSTAPFRQDDDNVFTEQNSSIFRLLEDKRNNLDGHKQIDVTNIRSCDICNYIFPTDSDINDIEKHYSVHYGPSCPVCFLLFRKGYPQTQFEEHVNSHFNN